MRVVFTFLLIACALIGHAAVAEARSEKGAKTVAGEYLQQGVKAVTEGRLEDALKSFTKAYEAEPTPDNRMNIAEAYHDLGKPIDACREYAAYLSEREKAGLPADKHAETIRANQCSLADNLATKVDVRSRPTGVELILDGTPIGRTPLSEPLRLDRRQHALLLDLPASAPEPVRPEEPERHGGWVFGAGLGLGANLQLGDDIQGKEQLSGLLALQLGYQINPTWVWISILRSHWAAAAPATSRRALRFHSFPARTTAIT